MLDASALVASFNDRDVHHAKARALFERLDAGEFGAALLPEYVFLEVANVMLARRGFEAAASAAAAMLESPAEFVPCADHFLEALEAFRVQSGGRLSFTDAAIVAIARGRGAAHVATFDQGFRGVEGLAVVP